MKRIIILLVIAALGPGIIISQSINLKMGIFKPSLQSDLWEMNLKNLEFNETDMLNSYFGAEYEVYLNRFTSFSVEIGSYFKEIDTQYRDYTHLDSSPIYQTISLRITPIETNMKFYPLGHRYMVIPYIGAGIGLYAWTYQQSGEFVIFPDETIEEGFAETKTYSFGFNGRLGLVFRFHPRLALVFEGKYQYLRGQLSGNFEDFDLLDLGGMIATIGINIDL